MTWRMRLDIEDDSGDERPSKTRRFLTLAAVVVASSAWVALVAAVAVWLAERIA